jgi:hypothetical protein
VLELPIRFVPDGFMNALRAWGAKEGLGDGNNIWYKRIASPPLVFLVHLLWFDLGTIIKNRCPATIPLEFKLSEDLMAEPTPSVPIKYRLLGGIVRSGTAMMRR